MLKRSEQGKRVLSAQRYKIASEIARNDRVAVEAIWTGVLATPFGSLAAGTEMKAHVAIFFGMRNGRIAVQRNYDCFEPW